LTCTFDASASSDPDGEIVSYTWDFGDDSGIATGIGPRYSFAAAGSYPVTLTVTDSLGAADSLTLAVAVG
jgi:PKD repeat protein